MTGRSALFRAARLGRPVAGRLTGGVLLSVLAVAAGVALLATSGYLISRAAQMPPILALTVAIVGVRFFAITRAVARYLERLVTHDAALRVLVEARAAFLGRLIVSAPGSLPRRGDLLSRAVGDVDRLQHIFVRALAPPVVAAVVVASAGLAAAVMLPAAAAVLVVALSATAVGVPLLSVALTSRANRRQAAARAELAVQVTEAVAASSELVALGRGAEQAGRVAQADTALQRLITRDALGASLASAVGTAASGLTVLGLLVVGVPAVADGRLAGVLLAALALMGLAAFEAVNGLPAAAQGMSATAAAALRLEQVAPQRALGQDGGVTLPRGPLRVDVRGALVRPAPSRPPAVTGLGMDIAPGERVALVGPSGCGKSTLARALAGLLPLDGGEILVDGVPIGDLHPATARARIRLCDQDAHLFGTTVAENVRLARPAASDEEVHAVLRRVGLGAWIETLPRGIHTYVGDDGARASGGQRQRIGLARGLLAEPDLLIVDEPTSHLDDDAARAFLDDLLRARPGPGLGVLMTTHRIDGLERFDRVLVMRDGRIVEEGPPNVLEREGTAYAAMCRAARLVDG